ncbi:hypothetical protein DB30_00641 [Enhygromyxa salina]|uniref:Uncharacterized protein n=1 Tax=Enhygromyxa salina TaxID=215803 RepID=A0A0C2D5B2_9BACT|nr:hypothetical protein DB30_00641 [Enhygromyxa salina]
MDPQSLSFETHSTITVTFVNPGHSILGVLYTPASTPPTAYPLPTTTSNSITFSDPNGATIDFSVDVRDSSPGEAVVGTMGPTTTIIFKPRTTCPS